jgi:hypothetical protein
MSLMQFSTTRWAMPVVAAALIALPAAGFAQTNPTQPPAQPPAQQTPATTQPAPQSAQPATTSAQPDAAAAKQHLTEARDALSQITSMPEASRLQGDARTQISQLISNFNALITAQSDWRSAYAKVDENLTTLLGPDSGDQPPAPAAGTTGTSGTVGTSGTSGSGLDPAIRAKLVEFRTHLKAFEKAAGGSASSASTDNPPSAMPPSAATGTTANPANPTSGTASTANPTGSDRTKPNPPSAMTGATGTTGTTPASSSPSASSAETNANAAAQTELAAIDAILNASKTGALTKAQTAQLRRHVEALRALLAQK